MHKKIISIIILSLLIILTNITQPVKAEEGSGITISPGKVIMQINDYGKKYIFTVKNNSEAKISFTASEGLISQDENGVTIPLDREVTTSYLEILTPEIEVVSGESAEIVVRTRIIGNETTLSFPALVIKSVPEKSTDIAVNYEMYIPFIAQNTTGVVSMNAETAIDANSFSTNPILDINGKITNDGDKFFNPSGTVTILKDGVKIHEQEITTQITGLLMPEKSIEYHVTWNNENDDILDALGEYTVETRITSDLSDKIYGSRINYMFIPINLIYISAGIVVGLIVILISIKIIKTLKKKRNEQ